MCGIIAIVGNDLAADRLLFGLKRLEYRGYDSAGVATLVDGVITRCRAEGKLFNLEKALDEKPLPGVTGIAHTRWATHGAPTENNAHPHVTEKVAVVHNGIIENFRELREDLEKKGHNFTTETDTEVIAVLVSDLLGEGYGPVEAVRLTLAKLRGAFSLAFIFAQEDNLLIGARRGSPLVVGVGDGEMYLGSDAIALAHLTNRVSYLEDGDWVVLSQDGYQVFDENDAEVDRGIATSSVTGALIDKGNYRHFMQKEIYEQPTVVSQTIAAYVDPLHGRVSLPDVDLDLSTVSKVTIVACGTSFYAGMIARYWIENLARIPVEVDIASEFRYREPVFQDGGLTLLISQSGETSDTLEVLRQARKAGQIVAAIVNVRESSMEREADIVLPTYAGPEIGVASTKAFTCQLSVLAAFATSLALARNTIDEKQEAEIVQAFQELPSQMSQVLNHDEHIEEIAQDIAKARDALYLGRGVDYPIALEGALKLKEISYIHAEGYAAGEMKHGPIALIDENVPVIVVAPTSPVFEKTISNMQEVIARGAKVVFISDAEGLNGHGSSAVATIEMPHSHAITTPLLYAIPVQLLAYHVAVAKGTDVDQPRNLAKSVTVE
ncbi:MAG: glutamine--fructose-6-phosphate transaminase (isomerizing) [Sphingomonadales bacterium]|jgi:glucosamine--fructose-6-phosphate aminotransferase (isomerizing)